MHEAQMHERNAFVTLTFSDENLPDDWSVSVVPMQLFFRSLRKRMKQKLRYFYCGEYGEQSLRPHYHALIFGVDFHGDRYYWRTRNQRRFYRSAVVEESWKLGHCEIGAVEYGSAKYVASYVMKKARLGNSSYERVDRLTGEVWNVEPEFVRMSRRPGIGAAWFEKYGDTDVIPRDEVVYDGVRFRTPRFYDSRLTPEALEAVKAKRTAAMREREASGGFTERKLADGETLLISKLKLGKSRDVAGPSPLASRLTGERSAATIERKPRS